MKVNVTRVVNQNIRLDINREFLDIFLGSGYTPSNVRLKRFHPIAKSILPSLLAFQQFLLNISNDQNQLTIFSERKFQVGIKFRFSNCENLEKLSRKDISIIRHALTRTIGRTNPPRNPFVSFITHSRNRASENFSLVETFNSRNLQVLFREQLETIPVIRTVSIRKKTKNEKTLSVLPLFFETCRRNRTWTFERLIKKKEMSSSKR